jgi:hypothetical protein
MPKPESIYRRLPGRGVTLTHYAYLYLGPDHLLQATATGYSETYKRFYFRDIQAIIIRKTNMWIVGLVACLLPGLAFAAGAISATDGVSAAVLWTIAGVLLLGSMVNLLLGPSCVCHLRTAVQTEKLPSLNRVRKAQKILGQIKPLIEAEQGRLNPSKVTI